MFCATHTKARHPGYKLKIIKPSPSVWISFLKAYTAMMTSTKTIDATSAKKAHAREFIRITIMNMPKQYVLFMQAAPSSVDILIVIVFIVFFFQ